MLDTDGLGLLVLAISLPYLIENQDRKWDADFAIAKNVWYCFSGQVADNEERNKAS